MSTTDSGAIEVLFEFPSELWQKIWLAFHGQRDPTVTAEEAKKNLKAAIESGQF